MVKSIEAWIPAPHVSHLGKAVGRRHRPGPMLQVGSRRMRGWRLPVRAEQLTPHWTSGPNSAWSLSVKQFHLEVVIRHSIRYLSAHGPIPCPNSEVFEMGLSTRSIRSLKAARRRHRSVTRRDVAPPCVSSAQNRNGLRMTPKR